METAYKAINLSEIIGGYRKSPVVVFLSFAIFNLQSNRYRQLMGMQISFTLMLVGILLLITWSDFRTQTIPNFFNGTLALGGLAAVASLDLISRNNAILGLILGVVAPFALRAVFRTLRGVDGLGLGDVKFLGASGLWIGASGLPWVVLMASLSGLVFALAVHVVEKNFTQQTRLAFGPHLALGLLVTWIFKLNGML